VKAAVREVDKHRSPIGNQVVTSVASWPARTV
jgi:hypothetical protein